MVLFRNPDVSLHFDKKDFNNVNENVKKCDENDIVMI